MISIDLMSWQDAQSSLSDEWRSLVDRNGLNPTLDPAWMDASIQSHGRAGDASVVVARRNSGLVGVLPILYSAANVRGIPIRIVELASNLVSYHPEIPAEEAHAQMLTVALEDAYGGDWDVFRANAVPAGCPTSVLLQEYFQRRSGSLFVEGGETSPYLPIETTWGQFLKTRDTRFRSNRSRVVRRVDEYGSTETRWFEGCVDSAELLQDILQIERHSWKAAKGIAISDRDFEMAYHIRLLEMLGSKSAVFANVLYISNQPIAYVLCCNWRKWIGQLKTSFDSRYKHVGAYVIDASIQRAFEVGATEYDFLGEATPHKLQWTNHTRIHHNYACYSSTARGMLIATGKRVAATIRKMATKQG